MTTRQGLAHRLGALATALLVAAVHVYQAVSSMTPGSCRFEPTCSQYALTALRRHGALRGGWLAVRRIARCHPLGGWGVDPVPDAAAPESDRGGRANLKETI
jgi:hypothetical protein